MNNDYWRLQVVIRASATSPAAVNDFYFRQVGEPSLGTSEEDLVARWMSDVMPEYLNLFTSVLEAAQINIALMPSLDTVLAVPLSGQLGGESGQPLPPRVAGLIRKFTGVPGRRGRGYWYLPPPAEGFSDGSGPSAGWADLADYFIAAILEGISAESAGHAAFVAQHYMPSTGSLTQITRLQASNRWASQNDRKRLY